MMKEEEIKIIILDTFKRIRQKPEAYFDELRFLDYLIEPPASKDNIKNSFKGVRKYYQFFEAIELVFGICFTLSDQDKFYSIDKFVTKTRERIENVRGNKMIIRQRVTEKDHYYFEFFLTLVLMLLVLYFKIHFVSLVVIIFYGIALWWILGSKLRDKLHNKKLHKVIIGSEAKKQ
jgi:hypothetical protein